MQIHVLIKARAIWARGKRNAFQLASAKWRRQIDFKGYGRLLLGMWFYRLPNIWRKKSQVEPLEESNMAIVQISVPVGPNG